VGKLLQTVRAFVTKIFDQVSGRGRPCINFPLI